MEEGTSPVSSDAEDINSDEEDPLHDDSILEDLFYKDVNRQISLTLKHCRRW